MVLWNVFKEFLKNTLIARKDDWLIFLLIVILIQYNILNNFGYSYFQAIALCPTDFFASTLWTRILRPLWKTFLLPWRSLISEIFLFASVSIEVLYTWNFENILTYMSVSIESKKPWVYHKQSHFKFLRGLTGTSSFIFRMWSLKVKLTIWNSSMWLRPFFCLHHLHLPLPLSQT